MVSFINKAIKLVNIDDIKTLGIEDLCDYAIGMLESGCITTDDLIKVMRLIKDRAKLLRE